MRIEGSGFMVTGLGSGVYGVQCRVLVLDLGCSGFRVWGEGVKGLGVQALKCRV